ncbi:MetQ/NlpA family ABC transporter substrate-binding protein [Intestinirhabdus alba]|jgi:D-methionine transport system substrate-binding protein|uniref:NLPA lipoprotein n=1 Tax=Intestinirhabdus alba TaxID=2899544 RepID=A0A6L6IGF0_9ENTR|nr:MetQ/NlpA family ABC transporter substrate-binding protein [Intestinirhabdus alba]MTH45719.1 NLPA lipoprotein [Intestinirhabdus alba]
MRKIVLLTLSIFFAALIAGCDNNKSAETDKSALTVACTEITETILSPALPLLKEQGLNVKLVIVDNNVNVIQAVNDGSVDAGLGVHIKFMENFNTKNNGKLTMVKPYPFTTGIGLYSERYKNIADLPQGATIAIMNDAMNMDRGLRMLQDAGLIKLNGNKNSDLNLLDITENTKDLHFIDMDQIQTVRALPDVDAAVVFFTHMRNANKDFRSYIVRDGDAKDFPMGLVVLQSNVDAGWAKTLAEGLRSAPVREGIKTNFDGVFEYLD